MTTDRIIDFHLHVGELSRMRADIRELVENMADRRDFDLATLFSSAPDLLTYLKGEGITRAVLIADEGPGVAFIPTTEFVADFRDAIDPAGEFFTVLGNINPNRTQDILAKHEEDKKRGIAGYKLYPADHDFHPITDELMAFYKQLEREHKILMFHTGTTGQEDGIDAYGDPMLFKPILDECPDLTVVLAHAGKPLWCAEATGLVRTYPNCYVDTAFMKANKILTYLPDLPEIADKVLFGSDWPVGVDSLSGHIRQIRALGLPQDVLDRLFYRNAAKVLGL